MNFQNLRTYIGLIVRLYPLLVISYLFYLVAIDFAYSHVDLIVINNEQPITNEDCIRYSVDYRLTQILIYFIVSANLLILSKLPTKLINVIFFTKRLSTVGIDFVKALNFYSTFYMVFGFVLVLLLAFIKSTPYAKYTTSFHYAMLALIPVYLIYQVVKKAKN